MNNINVVVRIRPENEDCISKGLHIEEKTNSINFLHGETQYDFPFDQVLSHDCSQEKVFASTGVPIIKEVLNGHHGTCLTYGQTGAGKTYTMTGPSNECSLRDEGLVMRSVRYLFQQSRRMKSDSNPISVKLSIVEIYNETLIDLLRDMTTVRQISPHTILPPIISESSTTPSLSSSSSSSNKLVIQETMNGVVVQNLCMIPIHYEDEVSNYLNEVHRTRVVAEHLLNKSSSRSHIMYTFYINRSKSSSSSDPSNIYDDDHSITSKFNLIDLAGSERVEKTGTSGHIQKEASYINKSLSFLEQVVLALSQSKRDHIPYRQSKLTMLLKDSLGGVNSCHTLLIACIWPSKHCEYETLSTLRFATRMKCIENHPTRHSLITTNSSSSASLPAKLRAQISYLKKEINIRDMVIASSKHHQDAAWDDDDHINSKPSSSSSSSSSGIEEMKVELNHQHLSTIMMSAASIALEKPNHDHDHPYQRFKQDIPIESLSQIEAMIMMMRNMIWDACDHNDDRVKDAVMKSMKRINQHHHTASSTSSSTTSSSAMIVHDLISDPITSSSDIIKNDHDIDVNDMVALSYEDFIQGPGKQLNLSYFSAKETIKSNKQRQRDIILIMNRQKSIIDDLSHHISHHNDDVPDDDRQDDEEYDNMSGRLDVAKQEYLAAKKELELCKQQLEETEVLKKTIMSTLLKSYEECSRLPITSIH